MGNSVCVQSANPIEPGQQSRERKPVAFKVMEFYGTGDPFFGGNANDKILSKSGELVEQWKAGLDDVAVFPTMEAAHEAAKRITNLRPGGLLDVIPSW